MLKHIEYQVFEPARLGCFEVTAHRIEVKRCPCGHKNLGSQPDGVTAHVQYGPKTKALTVYLHQYHLIPCKRVAEFFRDTYTLSISPGTICKFQKTTYDQLEATELAIASALLHEDVLGADETGLRVCGKTSWLHVLRSEQWTLYHINPRRGQEAINAMGILLLFTGVLMHDHWKPYFCYGVVHSLCNAHHLRELQAVVDRNNNLLAARMMHVLQLAWRMTKRFRKTGLTEIPAALKARIEGLYQSVLGRSLLLEYQVMEHRRQCLNEKKVRRTKAYNLFFRLLEYQAETLRFLSDFRVPFDNNGSERDVRMGKLKAKISGCFRSQNGASYFARIRGFISSAKKQGRSILGSILMAVKNYSGAPLLGC